MHFFSPEFHNLGDLLYHELKDLYDCEIRLCDAIPKMADAATSAELKTALLAHLRDTEGHCTRLETCFNKFGRDARRETCHGMKGMLAECDAIIGAKGDDAVRDAGLIAAAQRMEHYEMAAYGSARTFAEQLGLTAIAGLLQQTLDEEGAADKSLTQLAESRINIMAH